MTTVGFLQNSPPPKMTAVLPGMEKRLSALNSAILLGYYQMMIEVLLCFQNIGRYPHNTEQDSEQQTQDTQHSPPNLMSLSNKNKLIE